MSCSLFALGGCAAIFDGTSQKITIITSPPGAQCQLFRHGETIATLLETPGAVTVSKVKHDITATCRKAGFADGSYLNHSGIAAATAADALGGVLTGGAAWAVDSASGADNKYDSAVNMSLTPVSLMPPDKAHLSSASPPQT